MNLKDLNTLLEGVEVLQIVGDQALKVVGLAIDSRKVKNGYLFFAVPGTQLDGHDFITSAIASGAKGVICSKLPQDINPSVSYILVRDCGLAVAQMASNYYGNPSSKLKLVGVTGTNGKTTIATLLYELTGKLGYKAGLLSTIENRIVNETVPSTHTTPDLLSINKLMAEMVEKGCDYVFMEVSSHAIDQKRIAGLDFDGGIFTNLTAEHLDYHNSFMEYVYTKKKFFDLLKPEAFALSNADDKNGMVMLQNTKAHQYTYAMKRMADYKGLMMRNSLQGLHMKVNQKEVHFRLIGWFNAYNMLAIFGSAHLLGFDEDEILLAMSLLEAARGRFEIIYHDIKKVTAVIDYAHTADALENVLKTIQELREEGGAVITVAGAGGNRDKTKRPEMGKVAAMYSDTLILTSDNPRFEDPATIVEEMFDGIDMKDRDKVLKVVDRAEAIRVATKIASEKDVILIAGKGHEDYQEIKGKRFPFDDIQVLKNIWF